jgi:two-component system, chemotaxis family, sensor histidine kinase and response regulator PixL
MSKIDPNIRDQAYQFFRQESLDFLQTIEEGLISLREDRSIGNIHQMMRAAHSIKGGAASVELEGIALIAHRLEDVFRGLYRYEGDLDPDFESLLFQGFDLLRTTTLDQVQTGQYNAEAVAESEAVFEVLTAFLGVGAADEMELPTSAELGIDIVKTIFEGDVTQGIARLEAVLANAQHEEVRGEFHAQAEVFGGLGELFNLAGFKAIATESMKALDRGRGNILELAQVIIDNFKAAQDLVLSGDRIEGGRPSPELLMFAQDNIQDNTQEYLENIAEESIVGASDFFGTIATENLENSENLENLKIIEGLASNDQLFQNLNDISEFSNYDLQLTDADSVANLESIFTGIADTEDSEEIPLEADADSLNQFFGESLTDFFAGSDSEEAEEQSLDQFFGISSTDEDTISEEFSLFGNFDLSEDSDSELNLLNLPQSASSPTNLEISANFAKYAAETEESEEPNEIDLFAPSEAIAQDNSNLSSFFDGDINLPLPGSQTIRQTEISSQSSALIPSTFRTPQKSSPDQRGDQREDKTKEISTTPYLLETVRVDLKRLDRLSNLTGELVTQENGTQLQIQQLQLKIEQLQKRFGDFERITKSLEKWIDQSQKTEVRTNRFPREKELDPLLMDSYSGLYSIVQEGLEEVLQMNEGMRDMTMLTQQVQSIQRKKQQTLKQVRSDLLWSRMIPLNDILNRFPRMVRDLSLKYKKPVSLKLVGAATLIDKSTLEKLYDPLVHLVRNAFDHGADNKEERIAAGKPEGAAIEIRAYHRGNQTFIEVRDDGRGIDPDKIKAKAIATGLLNAQESTNLAKERIYSFLFAPSFSTSDGVSEISGRGVGLSTVQEQVTSLKGAIAINSEVGIGTTFTIRLPLTLTIAKLLIFGVDSSFFAIPVDSLVSIVTANESQLQTLQGQLFYRYQERLIPVMPTSGLSEHYPLPKRSLGKIGEMLLPEDEGITILLVSNGMEVIGIPADFVVTEQELVIKPFSTAIASPNYFYGCTIVADGSLVPVIDGSAMVSKWISQDSTPNYAQSKSPQAKLQSGSKDLAISGVIERPTILVIDDSLTARQTLVLTLEKSGYQVVQAGDGREALEQLEKVKNIDAIFCDVEMPVMNGFEFLTICRKQPSSANLPVVMLTSRSGQKHREIAKLLGATAYLTKPYLEQDLLNTVKSVLK